MAWRWHQQTGRTQDCRVQHNPVLYCSGTACRTRKNTLPSFSEQFRTTTWPSGVWSKDLSYHTTSFPGDLRKQQLVLLTTWRRIISFWAKPSLCHSKKLSSWISCSQHLRHTRSMHLSPLDRLWMSQGPKFKFTYRSQTPADQHNWSCQKLQSKWQFPVDCSWRTDIRSHHWTSLEDLT